MCVACVCVVCVCGVCVVCVCVACVWCVCGVCVHVCVCGVFVLTGLDSTQLNRTVHKLFREVTSMNPVCINRCGWVGGYVCVIVCTRYMCVYIIH